MPSGRGPPPDQSGRMTGVAAYEKISQIDGCAHKPSIGGGQTLHSQTSFGLEPWRYLGVTARAASGLFILALEAR